eukprot:TRINITY_DN31674_c0_g1_i1.p2 TRINITY_DN31674_c0_g1~~TRINITY_DN31674_c0_g1_i1.p2  ORF type:complete len:193 (+),score=37.00 TRINITY_DN31674_c0_g1_i1:82-579(+)
MAQDTQRGADTAVDTDEWEALAAECIRQGAAPEWQRLCAVLSCADECASAALDSAGYGGQPGVSAALPAVPWAILLGTAAAQQQPSGGDPARQSKGAAQRDPPTGVVPVEAPPAELLAAVWRPPPRAASAPQLALPRELLQRLGVAGAARVKRSDSPSSSTSSSL